MRTMTAVTAIEGFRCAWPRPSQVCSCVVRKAALHLAPMCLLAKAARAFLVRAVRRPHHRDRLAP
eukprot:3990034-Alexandrium_andersonii.AAC.1